MRRSLLILVLALALGAGCGGRSRSASPAGTRSAAATQAAGKPANARLILATTTSTVDSGLLDVLLPVFEKQSGYQVVPLSLGSGQALETGVRGEADVLLVHSPDAEQQFMAAGNGLDRRLVMHNDFIIVGPGTDPAGLQHEQRATAAMQRLAAGKATFVSRGDNSGTNALELKLWKQAGLTPKGQGWYIESGTGMGQTLAITSQKQGYTLSDRATFLAQRQNLQLSVLLENDPALLNIYHVIRVNPGKSSKINAEGATAFADFMLAPETQRLIAAFGRERFGQSLFFPDAGKAEQ